MVININRHLASFILLTLYRFLCIFLSVHLDWRYHPHPHLYLTTSFLDRTSSHHIDRLAFLDGLVHVLEWSFTKDWFQFLHRDRKVLSINNMCKLRYLMWGVYNCLDIVCLSVCPFCYPDRTDRLEFWHWGQVKGYLGQFCRSMSYVKGQGHGIKKCSLWLSLTS